MSSKKVEEQKLNKEQQEAIKHGVGPLLIIAGAGTGKTTVITERIKYLIFSKLAKPSEILALTFTEKAAREMEERVDLAMPYGYTQMWISTFHSFCDRVLRREALHIGLDHRYKLMGEAEAIQFIRNNLFKFNLDYFRPLGNPTKFIGGMLQHFSRLQDEDVTPAAYFAWIKKEKEKAKSQTLSIEEKLEHKKWLELAGAYKIYEELKVKEGLLDFGDLITKTLYLFRERKNILKEYQEQFKYVLIDEFQDTNYAQNELARLLAGKKQNITVCGDDDQCLPPNAMVSTPQGDRAIKRLKKGDEIITAVGKGYLSIKKINLVNKVKKKARFLTFTTESGRRLTVTDNHQMFCMISGTKLKGDVKYYVYLMWRENMGWRLGITTGLAQRLKLERSADKIIAIKSCSSEEEARFYETVLSMKYQIPTYPFKPRKRMMLTGEWLEKLFLEFDTQQNAEKLANDFGIDLNSHHYCLDGVVRGAKERIKIVVNMCTRRYSLKKARGRLVFPPQIYHEVRLESSSIKVKQILDDNNISTVKARKGWRIRKTFSDFQEASNYAQRLKNLTDGILEVRFDIGKRDKYSRSALMIPAGNILEGMYVPVKNNYTVNYEKVIDRKTKIKTSYVYDLEIDRTHNFIADGVVVHNSVYRFRGAAVSNIIQFRKYFPKLETVVLTRNYRSTQEVLDRSYDLIQHNNPDRLEVVEKIDKRLISQVGKDGQKIEFLHSDRVENEAEEIAKKIKGLAQEKSYDWKDFAILVRANNHSEPIGRALQRKGIPYQFLGPGRLFKQPEIIDLISYLKVLYNFEDSVSFYRLLTIEHFDIAPRDLATIGAWARKYNLSYFETCEKIEGLKVSDKTKKMVGEIVDIITKHLKLSRRETGGQLLYYFLQDTGLIKKLLNPESAEAEKVAANISKFFDKLKTYEVDHEDATVPAIVDWLELSSELGESPKATDSDWTEINAVNILTVHSAKGLEFPVVFLVNLVAQRFPTMEKREQIPIPEKLIKEVLPVGDYHLEEERRLFYVGMTRAKEMLFLTAADYYGEGKREKRLSPFIFEALGREVIDESLTNEKIKQLSFLEYSKPKIKESLLSNKLQINYLSYSQIETFKTCPLHYKLKYIFKVPTPPSPSQSFGISIHATLKSFCDQVGGGKKPNLKLITQCLNENWVKEGYSSKILENKFLEKGKLYLTGFLKEGFDPKNLPVVTEKQFIIPLRSENKKEKYLKIGGVIDRIDKLSDGTIEIIDYKTGATIPSQKEVDKNLQLSFYALAVTQIPEEPFISDPEKIKLTLYYLDSQEKISTVRTKEQIQRAKEEIFKTRAEIEKSDFKCSGSILCQKCEYALLCRG